MLWRIEVLPKKERSNLNLVNQIKDLGIDKKFKVYTRRVYLIEMEAQKEDIERIVSLLLYDPLLESYIIRRGIFEKRPSPSELLITYHPGVCDAVALSLERAIRDLSLEVRFVRTGRYFRFEGLKQKEIKSIAQRLLYNPLIEGCLDYKKTKNLKSLEKFAGNDYRFALKEINLLRADNKELLNISQQGCLALNLVEMQMIKDYFLKKGRNPTDVELETIGVLWSEHCAHKTFRGIIDYEEKDTCLNTLKKERINNLLKNTIMKATLELRHKGCVSVFSDNAGIVRFDKDSNLCFKVETHNHPSSLEPYGGAATGIGGVIRDILGTGQGARPFCSIDVFCFSPWDIAYKDLPSGLLHPQRIIKGVIKGVRDYGNRLGIPTVAGAVLFEERFLGNPLVYCGTLGLIPKEKSFKRIEKGDLVILCGAKTGRDGIHGATFSSQNLSKNTLGLTRAVQIGNPIEEKKLLEAILGAQKENLFGAITDCGAGGLSSAVTELSREYGVEVYLDKVPLKYKGLSYTEIWISESQERMVITAPERNLKRLKEIFKEEEVELTVIGRIKDHKRLVLFYQEDKVADIEIDFLFSLPSLEKKAIWIKKKEERAILKEKRNYNLALKNLLASFNISPKDWILREYDHEVQAGSVLRSIYGIDNIKVSDAALWRPDLKSKRAVAIGLGINPFYSDLDPYWMAALSIEEALRNIVAVGGDLKETYLLDNFSWGSPDEPSLLGGLVRASFACYDFAKYFGTPFISGKDSLYNEYTMHKKRIAIPSTLLISAVSFLDDWQNCTDASLKKEGNLLYLIGYTKPELGGSEFFRQLKIKEGIAPKIEKDFAYKLLEALSLSIKEGLVKACHDLSEGGLAIAISEMCFGNFLGAQIFLEEMPCPPGLYNYELLFSESPTRFLVEIEKKDKEALEEKFKGLPLGLIGCVSAEPRLVVYGKKCKKVIDAPLKELYKSWISTFRNFR